MAATPGSSAELAATLKALREKSGLSSDAASAAARISRSRLSRIEGHVFTPRPAEVEALCDVYRVPAATRRAMLAVVADVAGGQTPARNILYRGGSVRMQQRVARVEKSSRLIRVFQPLVVPGLLQTPAYVRAMMASAYSGRELDAVVAARLERQVQLDSKSRFVFLMTEGTFRWQAGSPEVMAGQLDYLAGQATARPNVRVGVITHDEPRQIFPGHGFSVYDKRTVILGVQAGTSFIGDDGQVKTYGAAMDRLERAAVYAEEAAAVIREAAQIYR